MKKLKKPEKYTKSFYVYEECREYLEKKFGYNERDYAGKYKSSSKGDPELSYLDFWNWVCDNKTPANGCYITFNQCDIDKCKQEWAKEILGHYIDEFGEEGEVELYASW